MPSLLSALYLLEGMLVVAQHLVAAARSTKMNCPNARYSTCCKIYYNSSDLNKMISSHLSSSHRLPGITYFRDQYGSHTALQSTLQNCHFHIRPGLYSVPCQDSRRQGCTCPERLSSTKLIQIFHAFHASCSQFLGREVQQRAAVSQSPL